jgi:hypothetical protein
MSRDELIITCQKCKKEFDYYEGNCTFVYCLDCFFKVYPDCWCCWNLGNPLCIIHCEKKNKEDWEKAYERVCGYD